MKVSHILWDWNGTLLDDTQACVNSINVLLAKRGVATIDEPRYRDIFGFPIIDFYRRLNFPLESENWDLVAREFHDVFLADTTFKLQSATVEVLKQIQSKNIGQSILSASEQSILEEMLTGFCIRSFFTHVCGVNNLYGDSKIEIGQKLLTRLAVPREAVVIVGDTLHDVEVAHALGISCVLIAQGHQSRSRLEQADVPVFDDLDSFCRSIV
jgi:phosphoglycolate phosphatase